MPQLNSGVGDDLGANDEMLAFKDEGEQEEKSQASVFPEGGDLADLKSSLVNESEGAPNASANPGASAAPAAPSEAIRRLQDPQRVYAEKLPDHMEEGLKHQDPGMYKGSAYSGYPFVMLSDPYLPNGSMSPLSNKVPVGQPSHGVHPLTPLIPYSNEHFSHGSHSPHLPADISQKQGVHRPSQTSDIPGFYSLPPTGVGQITSSMGWITHPLMLGSGMHTTGISHPGITSPGKQEMDHYDRSMKSQPEPKREKEAKKPTIKKPLNAFMLYMKEMRAKVIAECTLKESAAINQILGRRWHALSREEQAKYYELARKERQLHMQLYPGWSARDNYGKKKRRTREKQQDSNSDPASPKKCRARFGLNQQMDWCGPCRRKKKCIRYLQGGRCASPISSDGSAIDSPSSPLDVLQGTPSSFPPDKLAAPVDLTLQNQADPFPLPAPIETARSTSGLTSKCSAMPRIPAASRESSGYSVLSIGS
ncbi:transcription factor 7 isoform X4 [Anolis carolinensis]|uniref:transcription factor 7 isoform X4 n=1 Tax=Anolis carolinensis TaxID=28377 RepID=UPI000462CA35|nr:PREDICTED: transcription factor 7 isoform X4 [Anolis carolinensis]|eukprot:XP_008102964.1 PREDICTED: transcription factor 7 isoform X4 [Anolis carolinensis]